MLLNVLGTGCGRELGHVAVTVGFGNEVTSKKRRCEPGALAKSKNQKNLGQKNMFFQLS